MATENSTSAGQVAADAGAVTVPVFTSAQVNQNLETGTNAPTRTLEQTQGTSIGFSINPDGTTNGFGINVNATSGTGIKAPTTSIGVGAREDTGTANTITTGQGFTVDSSGQLNPQPNILDAYASYTYNISWYLLTKDQLNQMSQTGRPDTSTWKLLVRSGGIDTKSRFSAGKDDQIFSLDYYMDNFVIDTILPQGGGNKVNADTKLSFTLTEPNGITLFDNLYRAVATLGTNWQVSDYCLVIHFYGYDSSGNLISKVGEAGSTGQPNPADPKAIVVKYIPFVIEKIDSRIMNKAIEYHISGVGTPYTTGLSSQRGTIPFPLQLVGATVDDVLNGRPVGAIPVASTDGRVSTVNTTQTPFASSGIPSVDTSGNSPLLGSNGLTLGPTPTGLSLGVRQ